MRITVIFYYRFDIFSLSAIFREDAVILIAGAIAHLRAMRSGAGRCRADDRRRPILPRRSQDRPPGRPACGRSGRPTSRRLVARQGQGRAERRRPQVDRLEQMRGRTRARSAPGTVERRARKITASASSAVIGYMIRPPGLLASRFEVGFSQPVSTSAISAVSVAIFFMAGPIRVFRRELCRRIQDQSLPHSNAGLKPRAAKSARDSAQRWVRTRR